LAHGSPRKRITALARLECLERRHATKQWRCEVGAFNWAGVQVTPSLRDDASSQALDRPRGLLSRTSSSDRERCFVWGTRALGSTVHREVLYSNRSFLRSGVVDLPVGELASSTGVDPVSAVMLSVTDHLEAKDLDGWPSVLVATSGTEPVEAWPTCFRSGSTHCSAPTPTWSEAWCRILSTGRAPHTLCGCSGGRF
jgi:hypothetical protein